MRRCTCTGAERPIARNPLSRNESSTRQTLVFDDNATAAALYGEGDRTLRTLEREFGIHAGARGNEVRLVGPTDGGRRSRARCSSTSTACCAAAVRSARPRCATRCAW